MFVQSQLVPSSNDIRAITPPLPVHETAAAPNLNVRVQAVGDKRIATVRAVDLGDEDVQGNNRATKKYKREDRATSGVAVNGYPENSLRGLPPVLLAQIHRFLVPNYFPMQELFNQRLGVGSNGHKFKLGPILHREWSGKLRVFQASKDTKENVAGVVFAGQNNATAAAKPRSESEYEFISKWINDGTHDSRSLHSTCRFFSHSFTYMRLGEWHHIKWNIFFAITHPVYVKKGLADISFTVLKQGIEANDYKFVHALIDIQNIHPKYRTHAYLLQGSTNSPPNENTQNNRLLRQTGNFPALITALLTFDPLNQTQLNNLRLKLYNMDTPQHYLGYFQPVWEILAKQNCWEGFEWLVKQLAREQASRKVQLDYEWSMLNAISSGGRAPFYAADYEALALKRNDPYHLKTFYENVLLDSSTIRIGTFNVLFHPKLVREIPCFESYSEFVQALLKCLTPGKLARSPEMSLHALKSRILLLANFGAFSSIEDPPLKLLDHLKEILKSSCPENFTNEVIKEVLEIIKAF